MVAVALGFFAVMGVESACLLSQPLLFVAGALGLIAGRKKRFQQIPSPTG